MDIVQLMVAQLNGTINFIAGNGTKVIAEFPFE
jgi:hypothetical protein